MQRDDEGVIEPGRDPDLLKKAISDNRCGEFGAQDLYRHGAFQPQVARQVHDRHATSPDFAIHSVAR